MKDVIQKLRLKGPGISVNAPASIEKELVKEGFRTVLENKGKNSNVLVFLNNQKELVAFLRGPFKTIESDSVLWFAYPKGTSKIKTDINRDRIRVTAEEYGVTTVTAISIDDTWSALRFRPTDKVGS